MIARVLDYIISAVDPVRGLKRAHARKVARGYAGGENNRVNSGRLPTNQSADSEAAGPFGADALRAWARKLVRDNPWAWGVVDTIVSSVVGCGIQMESAVDTGNVDADELVNDQRDSVWDEWCEVCDLTGQFTFEEIQGLAQREIAEAGECLIHFVDVPREHNGISRPVPLALELIEADRLAADKDTYTIARDGNVRIVRGVELDEDGKPVAYWIYPDHPTARHSFNHNRTPKRIKATNVIHLFRRDRIGQTRGVTWFAPVVDVLRQLGIYIENEMTASAVSSCFTVGIKTKSGTIGGLNPPTTDNDGTDVNGNPYEWLEPGLVMRLGPDDDLVSANPGRPNSNATPWISLIVRAISAGTGLSYEVVAKDFSQTSYSSSRSSKLEDRRRFRVWQRYLMRHLCQPVWDRFCEAAAVANRTGFPSMADLLDDRRKFAPVELMPQSWDWVDPQVEQAASDAAIAGNQSTLQSEVAKRGGMNYRAVLKQRAREKEMEFKLGLLPPAETEARAKVMTAEAALLTAKAAMKSAEANETKADTESTTTPAKPPQQTDTQGDRKLSLAEALQKIYLSVGKVITEDEARKIIGDEYGIDLPPGELEPTGTAQ